MKELYTIGHSNHPIETFLDLLEQHGITAVCDVRSHPYSKYNPQFACKSLKETLKKHDIAYVFLGNELGARPNDSSCYAEGKVQYALLAQTPAFKEGIDRLNKGMESYRIALMCAEKDPLNCHRMILICRHLRAEKLKIKHILADGLLESQREAEQRLIETLSVEQLLELAYDKQSQKKAHIAPHQYQLTVREEDEDYEQDSTLHDWLREENAQAVF